MASRARNDISGELQETGCDSSRGRRHNERLPAAMPAMFVPPLRRALPSRTSSDSELSDGGAADLWDSEMVPLSASLDREQPQSVALAAETRRPAPRLVHKDSPVEAPTSPVIGSSREGVLDKDQRILQVEAVASAVASVIHDMLQMKYGLILDEVDLVRKLKLNCCAKKATVSLDEMIRAMNARPDLRFRVREGGRLVALHVESHRVDSFQCLQREIRRMPGTARSIAEVSIPVNGFESQRENDSFSQAVSVFREDYSRGGTLVGRYAGMGVRGTCAPRLVSFCYNDFRSALIVDPQITRELRCAMDGSGQLQESSPPALREEYVNLGAWLLPEETPPQRPSQALRASVAGQVLTDLVDGEATPSSQWMLRLRRALDSAGSCSQDLLKWLVLLMSWLDDGAGKEVKNEAIASLLSASVPLGLVDYVKRHSVETCMQSSEIDILLPAIQLVSLLARASPSCMNELARGGAVLAICDVMRHHPDVVDVQRAAMFALAQLLRDNGCVKDALSIDVSQLVHNAVSSFPGFRDLQDNSTRVMRRIASCGNEGKPYRQPHNSHGTPGLDESFNSEALSSSQAPQFPLSIPCPAGGASGSHTGMPSPICGDLNAVPQSSWVCATMLRPPQGLSSPNLFAHQLPRFDPGFAAALAMQPTRDSMRCSHTPMQLSSHGVQTAPGMGSLLHPEHRSSMLSPASSRPPSPVRPSIDAHASSTDQGRPCFQIAPLRRDVTADSMFSWHSREPPLPTLVAI